jgi:hypothetical protein
MNSIALHFYSKVNELLLSKTEQILECEIVKNYEN